MCQFAACRLGPLLTAGRVFIQFAASRRQHYHSKECPVMLSKTAEYALRAIACLGSQPGVASSADRLAEQTKVPRRYLNRVLQDLAADGLVTSRPGPGGGYVLTRDADKVTLLDVVNSVAPIERIRECPLGLQSHRQLCPLHAELDKAYAATEAAFRNVTIGELVGSTNPIVPLCEVPDG